MRGSRGWMPAWVSLPLWAACFVGTPGCGSGDLGGASVAARVGPAGGVVTLPDGSGVSIPPGALAAEVEIRVTDGGPAGAVGTSAEPAVGRILSLEPDGLAFLAPVEVTLRFEGSELPPGLDPDSLRIQVLLEDGTTRTDTPSTSAGNDDLEESLSQAADADRGTVTCATTHFSRRILRASSPPTPVTLTAPDGTMLRVGQKHKPERRSPGPDGGWGRAGIDDDGDGRVDDSGEFLRGPGNDDVSLPIQARVESDITHIVLHCTAGKAGTRFGGEVSYAAGDAPFWAHYYVDADGAIVQVTPDDRVALHVRDNHEVGSPGEGSGNLSAIGIEIFKNVGSGEYPGRQVSAVTRLCDYLLRSHAGIARPSATNPTGGILTHADQDASPGRKTDPIGSFRTGVMLPVSLEEVIRRALSVGVDGDCAGVINAKGGDALGTHIAGAGGAVSIESGRTDLATPYEESRPSLIVPEGATVTLDGRSSWMHVVVDGTLLVTSDRALDLDGILYVGPTGTLDARGGLDGAGGHSLDITCDGFALIEGRLLVNGTDKLGTTELAPFGVGSGPGPGGAGGSFLFKGSAPGPVWVPTIVARGGDANAADDAQSIPGGAGGDVTVHAFGGAGDPTYVFVAGRRNDPALDGHVVGLPDYLPPPGPFNQTVVISASPMISGTCPVNPTASSTSFLRPIANERLPLGRAVDATRAPGANVSRFRRGIITCGGLGGALSTTTPDTAVAPSGGAGGDITIQNDTTGRIRFLDAQVFSGAGAERLAYQIYVLGGSCADFKYFEVATGGAGGMCRLSMGKGGTGGTGGAAGDIRISGILHPALSVGPASSPAPTPILGYDSDNPNSSGGIAIGDVWVFSPERLSTSSAGGSGGSPGGSPTTFPGWFGARGATGATIINGQTLVVPP